mmetsp:Transcript_50441/g.134079  ORF Transcript_50441/g.134079 Transcript_50441/m.134079 type:complete len:468 (-) Transcript_50441:89-1492(-)
MVHLPGFSSLCLAALVVHDVCRWYNAPPTLDLKLCDASWQLGDTDGSTSGAADVHVDGSVKTEDDDNAVESDRILADQDLSQGDSGLDEAIHVVEPEELSDFEFERWPLAGVARVYGAGAMAASLAALSFAVAVCIFVCRCRSRSGTDAIVVAPLAAQQVPDVSHDDETLERIPEKRRGFPAARCSLGTPLFNGAVSKRIGNLEVWSAEGETKLFVGLPRGSWPWGLPSHRNTLAVWRGPVGKYPPHLPTGAPVLKLPLTAVTAVHSHGSQVRLEFSFVRGRDEGCEVSCRPELNGHLGTLVTVDFKVTQSGYQTMGKFMHELLGDLEQLNVAFDATPDLPGCGAMLPSRVYCQTTRQLADLAWALLNLAFLAGPVAQIVSVGISGLGCDGFLRLLMSSPESITKPVRGVLSRLRHFKGFAHVGRIGLLAFYSRLPWTSAAVARAQTDDLSGRPRSHCHSPIPSLGG